MEFFEAVQTRRSIRKFTHKIVPPEVIHKALDAALLAPAPHHVINYYEELVPLVYGLHWIGPLKRVLFFLIGLFRPITRGTH